MHTQTHEHTHNTHTHTHTHSLSLSLSVCVFYALLTDVISIGVFAVEIINKHCSCLKLLLLESRYVVVLQ